MIGVSGLVCSAREADLSDIAALQAQCFTNPWERPRLARELAREGSHVRVFRAQGRCEGHYLARQILDEIELLSIAVLPGARERGVGGALIQDLLDLARRAGGRQIFLEVRATNEGAISLYRKHGFSKDGTRPSYYSDGEDAVLMRYRVEPQPGEGSR